MSRAYRGGVVALLVATTQAAFWQTGCGKKTALATQESLPAVQVRVQTVEAKRQVATEDVVGTVRARLHAALEAKLSGRLENMPVTPGQTVKAGELLAQLDAREIQARLDQALALREQAARDSARLQNLLAQNAVSARNSRPSSPVTGSPPPPPRRRRCSATRKSSRRSTAL